MIRMADVMATIAMTLFTILIIFGFGLLVGLCSQQATDRSIVCAELYSNTTNFFNCTSEKDLSKVYSTIRNVDKP